MHRERPETVWSECLDSDLDPILKFDLKGNVVKSFGGGMFIWPHGMDVDREGNVWVTDAVAPKKTPPGKRGHQAVKFSPDGKVLLTLGTPGVLRRRAGQTESPSDVAVAANGDIFVADSHSFDAGNNRIVKYSKDGKFIKAWGKTGYAPGEFRMTHSIAIDSQGRVFVADRGNNRIQIFDQEGKFLAQWTQFGRPSGITFDAKGRIYVTDSESDKVQNPGWEMGIRIGDARTGWMRRSFSIRGAIPVRSKGRGRSSSRWIATATSTAGSRARGGFKNTSGSGRETRMNCPFKDAGRSTDGERARNPLPALWGRRLPGFGGPALQIALVLLAAAGVARGSGTNAGTFLLSAPALAAARARLNQGDAHSQPAFAKLREDAEAALELKPASVMDKPLTAVSGDKHDYFSYGPYWWPNPMKPDGLPYIRRDGERNPASLENTDDAAFSLLGPAIETLGLAYWFTGDERYARKAALLVRVWFLDPATRMNPNFQHAQAIPGITDGRGIGIIEARRLINVNEGLALIAGSPAWTDADRAAFNTWLTAFYEWLITSANGRDEQAAENNHGTWYDAQVAHLALVLGRTADAKRILTEGLTNRLARQIEPDGSQPLELARTKSLNYSIYNFEALFACARLAEHVGVDWWSFATSDGRSLRAALAYLAPYLDPAKPWPRKDIHPGDREQMLPLLAQYLRHGRFAGVARPLLPARCPFSCRARWRLLLLRRPGSS